MPVAFIDLNDVDQEVLAEATRILMAGEGPDTITTEPELTAAQFGHDYGTAGDLLGHWSVERGDPNAHAPHAQQRFADHTSWCGLCRFLERVRTIRDGLDYEMCCECGGAAEAHTIGVDLLGNPQVICVGEGP